VQTEHEVQECKNVKDSNLTARLCPSTENAVLTPEATDVLCGDSMYGHCDDSVTV